MISGGLVFTYSFTRAVSCQEQPTKLVSAADNIKKKYYFLLKGQVLQQTNNQDIKQNLSSKDYAVHQAEFKLSKASEHLEVRVNSNDRTTVFAIKLSGRQMKNTDENICFLSCFASCSYFLFLLAQLISCAITNHFLWRDCRCRRQQRWRWWHRHWHCCRQKLTSRSVPI